MDRSHRRIVGLVVVAAITTFLSCSKATFSGRQNDCRTQ
jgi:hypothetical protein